MSGSPSGSVPNAPKRSRARNASAAPGSPWRSSSVPCEATCRALAGAGEGAFDGRPVARLKFGDECLPGRRLTTEGAQDVETLHVRAAFPDRVQRALAEEPGQAALLDEAVAAERLERLADRGGRTLADPVLEHGRRDTAELVALVERSCEPQRADGRRLRLDAEVGEDILHQRLVDEQLPEGRAVRAVVRRLRDGFTDQ